MPSNEELAIQKILARVFAIQATGRKTTFADPVLGNESNDGLSPSTAKLYMQSAVDLAGTYGATIGLPGTFDENVVVNTPDLWLIGATYDGLQKTAIAPATGVALTLNAGLCQVGNMYITSGDDHCIQATGPRTKFQDIAVDVRAASKIGIWLDDADYNELNHIFLDGANLTNTIGLLFGNNTTSSFIEDSTITNFGTGFGGAGHNGYGMAFHSAAQRCRATHNFLSNNYYAAYCYAIGASPSWHTFDKNEFYLSGNYYDIYSPDPVGATGNRCDGNFYGYTGYYNDFVHSGIADFVVPCGDNVDDPLYDWAPLSAPDSWRFVHASRNR